MTGRHAMPMRINEGRERVEAMVRGLAPSLDSPNPVPFGEFVSLLDGVIHEVAIRVYDAVPKYEGGGEFHDLSGGHETVGQYDHERPPIGFWP